MLGHERKAALVVDLGGTKIIAAVVLPGGRVISSRYCLTLAEEGLAVVVARMISAMWDAVYSAKLADSQLCGICLAVAGPLDTKRGIITTSPHLPGWHNVPLRDIVAEEFNIATFIMNDASAAALGEHHHGIRSGKKISNLVYLTVSTGVGGGIIIDGQLYEGTDGCAGEIGHMTVEPNGPRCNCGNYGCLEALVSGTAIAREAIERLKQDQSGLMYDLVAGRVEEVTAEIVATAAMHGDRLACDIVAGVANYLGIGLASVVNIFNPELVVIGGGVARMGNMLLNPARRVVRERAFRLPSRTAHIVRARLGRNAGIIGAAAYVFEQKLRMERRA